MIHLIYNQALRGMNISQAKALPFVEAATNNFPNEIGVIELEIAELEPANNQTLQTLDDLALVHRRSYVEDVLSKKIPDGYGDTGGRNLHQIINANYCLLSAVRRTMADAEVRCIAAPVSGFHHAERAHGGGFCTFNGLAAATVLAIQNIGRVTILDFDDHYGNGTVDCLKSLNRDWSSKICHFTYGGYSVANNKHFFNRFLKKVIEKCIFEFQPAIVLYQAGVDSHTNDRIGSKTLTTEMLADRDFAVFTACRNAEIPIVWNLAGGYQTVDRVVELHLQTVAIATTVFKEEPSNYAFKNRASTQQPRSSW